jgi:hypothetical protein
MSNIFTVEGYKLVVALTVAAAAAQVRSMLVELHLAADMPLCTLGT